MPSVILENDGCIRIASDEDGCGNYTTVREYNNGMQEASARLIASLLKCEVSDKRSKPTHYMISRGAKRLSICGLAAPNPNLLWTEMRRCDMQLLSSRDCCESLT